MVTSARGGWQAHYLLARDRGFVPIRHFTVTTNGVTTNDVEIAYVEDQRYGWVPTQWTSKSIFRAAEGPAMIRHVKVTKYAFNDDASADDLRLVYPVGTWVSDNITNERYIVRPKNGKRMLDRKDGTDDYERIMAEIAAEDTGR